MKDIFTGYRILGQQFFSFSTWKICCHFLLASVVSDEKFTVIQIAFSLKVRYCFSLMAFKNFFEEGTWVAQSVYHPTELRS